MHPENRYDAPYTLPILEPLIVALQERGYRLVTLDELVTTAGSEPAWPNRPLRGRATRRLLRSTI